MVRACGRLGAVCLNAPSGAQCFPTVISTLIKLPTVGSQCTFWCSVLSDTTLLHCFPVRLIPVSMHLLVLSAFRLHAGRSGVGLHSTVSMHLLVLSAFRLEWEELFDTFHFARSQCTFWCSVLSDPIDPELAVTGYERLNAPSGAQSFPTGIFGRAHEKCFRQVSMHLLVLSAFRPQPTRDTPNTTRVSMHLLVLSAFRRLKGRRSRGATLVSMHLLVLSAFRPVTLELRPRLDSVVSMHLLVLSAFRPETMASMTNGANLDESQCTFWCSVLSDGGFLGMRDAHFNKSQCTFWCSVLSDFSSTNFVGFSMSRLNAPSGAQCFPTLSDGWRLAVRCGSQCTFWCSVLSDYDNATPYEEGDTRLNAPSGAQCFPTSSWARIHGTIGVSQCTFWCSVLSDLKELRREAGQSGLNAPSGAQCFPTIEIPHRLRQRVESQCTFWCSVLSDVQRSTRC